jgi:hypothetical protein
MWTPAKAERTAPSAASSDALWAAPTERIAGHTTAGSTQRGFRLSRRTAAIGGVAAIFIFGAIGALGGEPADSTAAGASGAPTAEPTATPKPTRAPTAKPVAVVETPAPTPPPTPAPTLAPTPEPTPPPTPVPTERRRSTKAMVESAMKVSYEEVFRNSDSYLSAPVYFKGEVIQVLDGGDGTYTLRINVTKGEYGWWEDTVLVLYAGDRVLEEDIVDFVGIFTGPYTYESVLGGDITVPGIDVTIDNQTFLRVIG